MHVVGCSYIEWNVYIYIISIHIYSIYIVYT